MTVRVQFLLLLVLPFFASCTDQRVDGFRHPKVTLDSVLNILDNIPFYHYVLHRVHESVNKEYHDYILAALHTSPHFIGFTETTPIGHWVYASKRVSRCGKHLSLMKHDRTGECLLSIGASFSKWSWVNNIIDQVAMATFHGVYIGKGVHLGYMAIRLIIIDTLKANGCHRENTIASGFSQGGQLALMAGLDGLAYKVVSMSSPKAFADIDSSNTDSCSIVNKRIDHMVDIQMALKYTLPNGKTYDNSDLVLVLPLDSPLLGITWKTCTPPMNVVYVYGNLQCYKKNACIGQHSKKKHYLTTRVLYTDYVSSPTITPEKTLCRQQRGCVAGTMKCEETTRMNNNSSNNSSIVVVAPIAEA